LYISPPDRQQNSNSQNLLLFVEDGLKTPQIDETMDSIKAQIAALRQSCSKAAFAIEVASVTDSPLDKVINASTLRLMGECALILDGEIRQLTETGVSHFQLVLEQSHATVEKVARVLGPSIDRKKMVSLLKESPGGITEVRMDGALLNVLLLHLRVMVAVVGLPAGG
jgi:hypothetical protein